MSAAVQHSFEIERTYPAPLARVWRALADPSRRARWCGPAQGNLDLDFRPGGHERDHGVAPDGTRYRTDGTFAVIEEGRRTVSTGHTWREEELITVSLLTMELSEVPGGTRLQIIEHGVYLGADAGSLAVERKIGTQAELELLDRFLEETPED